MSPRLFHMSPRLFHATIVAATRFVAVASIALVLVAEPVGADYTLDRWYQMGDDILFSGTGASAENASNGAAVGSGSTSTGPNGLPITFDSAAVDAPTFQPLEAHGTTGLPVYVEYGVGGNPAAPVAGAASMNSFGIEFDGIDDWLSAVNLNDPSVSAPGSTITYPGTSDRGMQLWVYPTDIDGVGEYVIDDADQHGFNINTGGNWLSQKGNQRVSSPNAASQDAWTHLALVHDSAGTNGAVFYVDGLASVTHTANYNGNDSTDLLVGANAEDDGGTTQDPDVQSPPTFFSGIVDEIELFVIDDGTTYGAYDYTKDNGYFTDVWLPTQSGYGFTLDPSTGHNSQQWVKGDINFDGVLDQLDVDDFVAGWLSERDQLTGPGSAQIGDYLSLDLGDLDLDGDTDLGDWVRLRQYNMALAAGLTLPSLAELNAVPEPSTGMLLLLLCGGRAVFRSARQRR